MLPRIATCAWLLCVVLPAARADEPDAPDAMKRGLAAYEELDYQRAVIELSVALTRAERREDKLAIVRALAFSHVALDELDQARAAFQLLLQLDPQATLDRTISPRARAVFDEAQANVQRAASVTTTARAPLVAALAPAKPRAGRPIALSVLAAGGVSAQLYYRTGGRTRGRTHDAAQFSRLDAEGRDGKFALAVPGLAVEAPAFEYYLVVLDERGAPAGEAGTADRPLAIPVETEPPRRPVYRRAWFWGTVAGAACVVAATVAGVVVGVGGGSPSSARVVVAHP